MVHFSDDSVRGSDDKVLWTSLNMSFGCLLLQKMVNSTLQDSTFIYANSVPGREVRGRGNKIQLSMGNLHVHLGAHPAKERLISSKGPRPSALQLLIGVLFHTRRIHFFFE